MLDTDHAFTQSYPAVPDSVAEARGSLTDFALAVGVDGERLEAIRLAASEAITNAVIHAYEGRGPGGSIQLNASYVDGEFWLLIGDDGTGLRPRGPHSGLGLGLALIAQLADEFQILSRSTGGTELRMQFKLVVRRERRPTNGQHGQLRGSVSSAVVPA
jgi:anti-sigma regulatory factor (Ser/Thr protein kinase)